MNLRRFDTLFLRLFVLMWVTLVLSHVFAFVLAGPLTLPGTSVAARLEWGDRVVLPSLPPGGLLGVPRPPPGANHPQRSEGLPQQGGPPPGLPSSTLWLDYGLRALLIGLGALLGARWLAAPMRRLTQAAGELSHGLGEGRALPQLEEAHGTVEVRDAARVFNHMTQRLQEQFDQRSLHLAAVSHDLRTPLTRLRLRLEQLPPESVQAAIGDLRDMDELIDNSLAVVREQAGADPSLVDLGALLHALVDDCQEQGQPVTLDEPPSARVRVHPASLRRILDNLVGNALRYGTRARLMLAPVDAGAGVAVHIDDDGPGMPPEQVERAFRPWVRLPGAAGPQGHGLGLAIARDLAEREGATLSLHNREEGGLRATLVLPSA
jgi:signal transduction histidine kinase